MKRQPPISNLFPYTTLCRSGPLRVAAYPAALSVPMLLAAGVALDGADALRLPTPTEAAAFGYLGALVTAAALDRKSTRLNSSHANISYAVFCLKKKILHYN